MKKQMIRILFAAILMSLPLTSHALEVAVEGGLSISSPSYSSTDSTLSTATIGSKTSFTYGATAGFSIFPGLQFETGLNYLPRKSALTVSTVVAETSFNSWMVPMMVRVTALPFLSVAAGTYYSMGTGQVTTTTTIGTGTPSASNDDFGSASGITKNAWGLMGSVRFEMPVLPLFHFLIDARYLKDLTERSTDSAASFKGKDIQVLAGASFGF